MLKYFYLAVLSLVFAVMSTAGAVAGPQDRSVRSGEVQLAQNWNDRICCKRGNNDFWTTWRRCERWGGHRVRNAQCRDDWDDRWDERWWQWGSDWDRRICCKRGNRDWWTTARDCRNSWGYETNRRECREDEWRENWDNRWRNWTGDWNKRICCEKGNREFWSTRRECRDRGGWQTSRRECRNNWNDDDWNDSWDNRWRNWTGDWNRRICCEKGNREFWSTRRECRDRGGWQTERRDCRNNWNDDDD